MASKQTRRSISVRGTTYSLLRDFCAEHERSMSDVVEELLSRILEDGEKKSAARPKTVAPLVARAAAPAKAAVGDRVAAVADRAAVRVVPLPAPAPRAEAPARPAPAKIAPPKPSPNAPARPTPVSNAGRPAPTPVATVKETPQRSGDYRAIRF